MFKGGKEKVERIESVLLHFVAITSIVVGVILLLTSPKEMKLVYAVLYGYMIIFGTMMLMVVRINKKYKARIALLEEKINKPNS